MRRPGYAEGVTNEGAWSPDNLFAGTVQPTSRKVTVAAGEAAADTVRGAVMGTVTVGGQVRFADTGNADGSQTPDVILAHDVDASAATAEAIVYPTGNFNRNALVSHASIDLTDATVIEGLRVKGILMEDAQAAP